VRAALLAAALWCGSCAEQEPEPLVRLIVESQAEVPTVVDEVVIDVTASRTPAGATCAPASRSFHLDDPADLPVTVAYVPGPVYDDWIAFRIAWRHAGADLAVRVLLVSLPTPVPPVQEQRVTLERACLRAACAADQQCAAGMCVPYPSPDPFDPTLVDPGQSCQPHD
jgi:hypothetical protein